MCLRVHAAVESIGAKRRASRLAGVTHVTEHFLLPAAGSFPNRVAQMVCPHTGLDGSFQGLRLERSLVDFSPRKTGIDGEKEEGSSRANAHYIPPRSGRIMDHLIHHVWRGALYRALLSLVDQEPVVQTRYGPSSARGSNALSHVSMPIPQLRRTSMTGM
jgi:hypothetical protein